MPDEIVTAGSFDAMRDHITEQLTRITAENVARGDAIQREIDQQIAQRCLERRPRCRPRSRFR